MTQATGRYKQVSVGAGTTDDAASPIAATEAAFESLQETHTDLQAAEDLKKIGGIGVRLTCQLNAAGTFSYV